MFPDYISIETDNLLESFFDRLKDASDTRTQPRNDKARGFRWSGGRSAGSTRSTIQKGIYFGLLTSPNITQAGHCVRTRVLDISIAWMKPVPGHIVGERVYRYGPGANTAHCVGRAPSPTTLYTPFRYHQGGYPAGRK